MKKVTPLQTTMRNKSGTIEIEKQGGTNEEETDRGRGRNLPPQPRQVMNSIGEE